jgi:hypothetical protein
MPPAEGEIVEHDLEAALQEISQQETGWAAAKKSVRCQSCDAITVFDTNHVAKRCDFCGSPAIIAIEDQQAPIRPESILPFKVSETEVRENIRKWYATRWFAPNRMKKDAMTDTLHGLYIPYWTFDASVEAHWTADAGYYYTVPGANNRPERRIRWESVRGHLTHFFDDELVSGSRGVELALLKRVEPFPTRTDLQRYDPGFVSGWLVEQYQVDLPQAAGIALDSMRSQTRSMCSRMVPGDTQRNLRVDARFWGRTFKHALVPVWLLSYQYGTRAFQVVVNGYTGRIAGRHPYSWIKITFLVLAILAVVLLIFSLGSR